METSGCLSLIDETPSSHLGGTSWPKDGGAAWRIRMLHVEGPRVLTAVAIAAARGVEGSAWILSERIQDHPHQEIITRGP
jgi:hypothetical protein